tara:strand:+ start:664 stop:879 length:216 start_codon:yes stop_codon:yes gene_type:complete
MLKYKKIFKTYFFHNMFGHPIMEILNILGKNKWANYVHDQTLPKAGVENKNTANTEDDVPETNRVIPKEKD